MKIKSLDEVINRLQYKADNIKAKLEPSYFTECIEYLKSLPLCDDGWILCSVKMPEEPETGMRDIECLQEYNVMIEGADAATTLYYAGDGEWYDFITEAFYKVIAWQPLPQPYVKGE
mgnify:CR=1 FL=1